MTLAGSAPGGSRPSGMPPSPSCSSWPRMASAMAAETPAATGSTRSHHTGMVASTHSARLHAAAATSCPASSVASSSHSRARSAASATWRPAAAPSEGSPDWAIVRRATSVAAACWTGPSSADSNIERTCAPTICSMAGSTWSSPMSLSIEAIWGSSCPPVSPRRTSTSSGGRPSNGSSPDGRDGWIGPSGTVVSSGRHGESGRADGSLPLANHAPTGLVPVGGARGPSRLSAQRLT